MDGGNGPLTPRAKASDMGRGPLTPGRAWCPVTAESGETCEAIADSGRRCHHLEIRIRASLSAVPGGYSTPELQTDRESRVWTSGRWHSMPVVPTGRVAYESRIAP